MSLDIILKKAEAFERAIEERHTIEGLILPTLVLPPWGSYDLQTGNYENCAIWTGEYVAAQTFKFAATGDLRARAQAKESLNALHKLKEITNEPGVIARGFKLRDEPSWDELFFWIKEGKNLGQSKLRDVDFSKGDTAKLYDGLFGYRRNNEWHQEGNYRWLGDASNSQVFGVLFGYFAFSQFCNPTTDERELIRKDVAEIVNSLLEHKMQIVDKDKKKTTYGGNRRFFGYGIGPAISLSEIKLAHHLTGGERFRTEYELRLEAAMKNGSITPNRPEFGPLKYTHTNLGSDDNLAMLNYYMLMALEKDKGVLDYCKNGLTKRWHSIDDPENSLFNFISHALLGEESPALQQGINALINFPDNKFVDSVALKREITSWNQFRDILMPAKIHLQDRPVDEYAWRVNPFRHDRWVPILPGRMEFTGIDFLIAYYFGKCHGIIG